MHSKSFKNFWFPVHSAAVLLALGVSNYAMAESFDAEATVNNAITVTTVDNFVIGEVFAGQPTTSGYGYMTMDISPDGNNPPTASWDEGTNGTEVQLLSLEGTATPASATIDLPGASAIAMTITGDDGSYPYEDPTGTHSGGITISSNSSMVSMDRGVTGTPVLYLGNIYIGAATSDAGNPAILTDCDKPGDLDTASGECTITPDSAGAQQLTIYVGATLFTDDAGSSAWGTNDNYSDGETYSGQFEITASY